MGLPPFNTRDGFDYGQLGAGVYRAFVAKHGDNPLGIKIGGNMILKNYVLEEFTVVGDKKPKKITMMANVIIERDTEFYDIPIRMYFEYKDNGSYLANYKKSVEQFMDECERYDKKWKVNPKRDKQWRPYPRRGSFNMKKIERPAIPEFSKDKDTPCFKCGYLKTGSSFSFYKCFGTPKCPVTKLNPDLDNSV